MAAPPNATVDALNPPSSDAASKTPTSSHRLPTVSASDAFRNLSDDHQSPSNAYTDISELDDALGGGFECGRVTELWGPPGAGKTAIALKAATSVLQKNAAVVWIDTSHAVSTHRVLSALPKPHMPSFHHSLKHTLPHLLAFLLHPPSKFPPAKTHLLVLTNLHTLLETSNPRNASFSAAIKPDVQKWAASRRYALLGSIVSALNRLAARHDIAVLVTTGCATRMRSEFGAPGAPLGLVPGVGGSEWETGIWARSAVLRDFGGRFAGISKVRGTAVATGEVGLGTVVGFAIGEGGVAVADEKRRQEHAKNEAAVKAITLSPVRGRKRALEEIADSDEDEEADEYGGWIGLEDDSLAGVDGADGDGPEKDEGNEPITGGGNATIVIDRPRIEGRIS